MLQWTQWTIKPRYSERENMGDIKITVEVNGKQVPLEIISTETFEMIKALEKPKEIPVARVGNWNGDPNDRRLFLKITDNIRSNIADSNIDTIVINLQHGVVNNSWGKGGEDNNIYLYENVRPL